MLGTRPYGLGLVKAEQWQRDVVTAADPRWWGLTDALVSFLGGRWRQDEGSLVLELDAQGENDTTALIGLGVCLWHMGCEVVLDTADLQEPDSGLLDLVASLVQYGLVVTIRHPYERMGHELSLHGLRGVPDESGTELRVLRAARRAARRRTLRLARGYEGFEGRLAG